MNYSHNQSRFGDNSPYLPLRIETRRDASGTEYTRTITEVSRVTTVCRNMVSCFYSLKKCTYVPMNNMRRLQDNIYRDGWYTRHILKDNNFDALQLLELSEALQGDSGLSPDAIPEPWRWRAWVMSTWGQWELQGHVHLRMLERLLWIILWGLGGQKI